MSTEWRQYQHDAAALFRKMGFDATVEETLVGARASHDVDVVVRLTIAGVSVLWIVECKLWKSSVRKEQVMTLVQIAQDVGADRAILLSESGFQAGALMAVRSTNVTLTNLEELAEVAADDICRHVFNQTLVEKDRLERQIRGHLYDDSGDPPNVMAADIDDVATLLGACLEMGLAISHALIDSYPIRLSGLLHDRDELFIRPRDLAMALQRDAAEIRDRAERLDALAKVRRTELLEQADQLTGEIDTLVSLGGDAFAVSDDDPRREPRLVRCVESMRRIGALTESLRPYLRGRLFARVRDLRERLIDGAYLALATPQTDLAIWRTHAETARQSAQDLREALAAERDVTHRD